MRDLLGPILLLGLLSGCGDSSPAVRAYQEGRYKGALDLLTAAEQALGRQASPELLYNRALAALRAGDLVQAEISADKAAARGRGEFIALRDFLLGNAAFARCEKAEAETFGPKATPSTFDAAITHAEAARNFWQNAAASRNDWPEARRNVERAFVKLEALKGRKKEALESRERSRQETKSPEPPPSDPTEHPDKDQQRLSPEEQPKLTPQLAELSAEQVERLLEKLGQKEKEKLRLRWASRQAAKMKVEKDW